MTNFILKITQAVAFVPFLATSFPVTPLGVEMLSGATEVAEVRELAQIRRREQARLIDDYMGARSMPLEGLGMKMVTEAEKNNIDWRLVPAIAIRESSGGKHMCKHNPFGWASCKVTFKSTEHSIEVIAHNLGGNNPRTEDYYSGTTREKLYHYNGTVVPTYMDEVIHIMNRIGPKEVEV